METVSSLYNFTLQTDSAKLEVPAVGSFIETIVPHLREIANVHHRIKLRLNPEEHSHLAGLVSKINGLFSDINSISNFEETERLIENLIKESQTVLKNEWKRVKRGEAGFIITKYSALFVFLTMIVLSIGYLKGWIAVSVTI